MKENGRETSKEKTITSVHLMTGLPARPDEQLLSNKTQVCFISCKNIKQRKND